MDYGDYHWRLYRDYYRDPLPQFPTKHQGAVPLAVAEPQVEKRAEVEKKDYCHAQFQKNKLHT